MEKNIISSHQKQGRALECPNLSHGTTLNLIIQIDQMSLTKLLGPESKCPPSQEITPDVVIECFWAIWDLQRAKSNLDKHCS